MRRVGLGNTQQPHISNRNSAEFDSLSSAAPPCYTSQRGETTSVTTIERSHTTNDDGNYDDDDDDTSVSMHSFPDVGPNESLPSPYSTEDLRLATSSRREDPANPVAGPSSAAHSRHATATPPPTSDAEEHSATPIRSGTTSSGQSPAPYHNRDARHSSMPSSPYASDQGYPRTSESSASPQALYHHRPTSQPAGIGHLTHRHSKRCYEVYHDANEDLFTDDEDRLNQPRPPMDSTITFLPEGPHSSAPHLLRKPQPHGGPRGVNGSNTSGAARTPSIKLPPQPASQDRATNYVSLSRKSTFKKPGFFSKSVVSSSITGKFTIDPGLSIPSSLLKAFEPPGKISLDMAARGLTAKPSDAKSSLINDPNATKPRRKNLSLEVENGGIDVDIHLVPSLRSLPRLTSAMNPNVEAGARRMPNGVYTSPTRLSLDKHYYSEEPHGRPGLPQRQQTQSSVDGHTYAATPSIRKYTAPPPPVPTLIELTLKEMKNIVRKSSSTKPKNEFSLVARIHAPNPRPPFHLMASTVDMPASARPIPPALQGADTKPSAPAGVPPPVVRPPVARTRPIHMLPRSSLTLHLPRTFHGPLTVHVAAGDIDAHLRLSKGLLDTSVALAESAYSRGYFVGKLREADEKVQTDLGPDWVLLSDDDEPMSGEATLRPSFRNGVNYEALVASDIRSHDRHGGSTSNDDEGDVPHGDSDEEWKGDKVDVHVGHGKVYLQFVGEEDPFSKKGRFWNILGKRHY